MNPTFAQTLPLPRNPRTFGPADENGCRAVHSEFFRAVLKYGAINEIHLFTEPSRYHLERGQAVVKAFRQEFSDREIGLYGYPELPTLIGRYRYLFLASGVFPGGLVHVRSAAHNKAFPICALTHALDETIPISASLFCKPYDAFITPSNVGYRVLTLLFDIAGQTLARAACRRPRIVRLPYGVDTTFYTPQEQAYCRRELDIPIKASVILYFGRISRSNKADLTPILLLSRRLQAREPSLMVVIAGHSEGDGYVDELKRQANLLGISNAVRIIEDVSLAQKSIIYSAADIFASPVDNIQETFGLSVLEAMACGIPAVVSDWSGYKDLVEHGHTGFLVPTYWPDNTAQDLSAYAAACSLVSRRAILAQATILDWRQYEYYLNTLLRDESLRRQMGEAARNRVVNTFSWQSLIPRYEELWKDQLQQCERQPSEAMEGQAVIDYNAIFRIYASGSISQDLSVISDGNDECALSLLLHLPTSKRMLARKLLRECENAPRALGSMLNSKEVVTSDIVKLLLKWGLLRVAGA
jgi:glycosyltransferase involved in cell wall biosynthesis